MNTKGLEHQSDANELHSTAGIGLEQLNPSQEALNKLEEARESIQDVSEQAEPQNEINVETSKKRPSFGCSCSSHCGSNYGIVGCSCSSHCGSNYGKE